MALKEVKFKQGQSASLTQSLATSNIDTIFAAVDKAVMAIGGQLFYGQPTIEYKDNKIVMYGISGDTTVTLGEVDLSLESFLEGAKFIPGKSDTEGYDPTVAAYQWASGISTSITQANVTAAYTEAFGASYSGDKGAVVMVMHTESSAGDTHSIVVLPIGKILGDTQTEIDNVEKAVGLKSDGTYSADTTTTYVSAATSVNDAIKKLDTALSAATSQVSLTSPNETLNVVAAASGTTADVNHDKVTIKQSSGNTYENGDTIADNDLYAADAVIEEGFKVLGGTVGQLSSGQYISGGTTVIELLKKMLVKEADCTAVSPTCTLSISPSTTPVEVGTVLTETLSSTYTDGKFTGSSADYGSEYSVNAGCAQGTVTYKRGTTELTSASDTITMTEGTTTWSCTSTYGASTVTPKKNNGADSTKTIAAGTTAASSKSITAQYKYYIGATTEAVASAMTVDKITATTIAKSSYITVDGTTTLVSGSSQYTMPTQYFVVMVPKKYKLATIQDYTSGSSYLANFTTSTVEVAIGGDSKTEYTVYLWVKSQATPDTKNITITKA